MLTGRLAPLPGQAAVKVRATLPHRLPWQGLLGQRVGALRESNILVSLNDPLGQDFSWLRPGKSDFHWWNGDMLLDTLFPPSRNFEFSKSYN